MVKGSRFIIYFLLALCVIFIIYFTAPLVSDLFQTTDYGFSVEFIDQNEASTGEIVHLTEEDLEMSPELGRILSGESPEGVRLNEEEYHFYRRTYPNYSQNVTGRAYYEYQGRFFYLRYHRDDVNVL